MKSRCTDSNHKGYKHYGEKGITICDEWREFRIFKEWAMERFKALKQGQNFHALDDSLKTNTYTDVSRTQNTIYLRLDYDQPSGTVVNVRKSMWVHPVLDRAVSIREAARLQTFPDSFVFCGTKDSQYQQVGNAVPPIMAKEIANELAMQLKRCLKGRNNRNKGEHIERTNKSREANE